MAFICLLPTKSQMNGFSSLSVGKTVDLKETDWSPIDICLRGLETTKTLSTNYYVTPLLHMISSANADFFIHGARNAFLLEVCI